MKSSNSSELSLVNGSIDNNQDRDSVLSSSLHIQPIVTPIVSTPLVLSTSPSEISREASDNNESTYALDQNQDNLGSETAAKSDIVTDSVNNSSKSTNSKPEFKANDTLNKTQKIQIKQTEGSSAVKNITSSPTSVNLSDKTKESAPDGIKSDSVSNKASLEQINTTTNKSATENTKQNDTQNHNLSSVKGSVDKSNNGNSQDEGPVPSSSLHIQPIVTPIVSTPLIVSSTGIDSTDRESIDKSPSTSMTKDSDKTETSSDKKKDSTTDAIKSTLISNDKPLEKGNVTTKGLKNDTEDRKTEDSVKNSDNHLISTSKNNQSQVSNSMKDSNQPDSGVELNVASLNTFVGPIETQDSSSSVTNVNEPVPNDTKTHSETIKSPHSKDTSDEMKDSSLDSVKSTSDSNEKPKEEFSFTTKGSNKENTKQNDTTNKTPESSVESPDNYSPASKKNQTLKSDSNQSDSGVVFNVGSLNTVIVPDETKASSISVKDKLVSTPTDQSHVIEATKSNKVNESKTSSSTTDSSPRTVDSHDIGTSSDRITGNPDETKLITESDEEEKDKSEPISISVRNELTSTIVISSVPTENSSVIEKKPMIESNETSETSKKKDQNYVVSTLEINQVPQFSSESHTINFDSSGKDSPSSSTNKSLDQINGKVETNGPSNDVSNKTLENANQLDSNVVINGSSLNTVVLSGETDRQAISVNDFHVTSTNAMSINTGKSSGDKEKDSETHSIMNNSTSEETTTEDEENCDESADEETTTIGAIETHQPTKVTEQKDQKVRPMFKHHNKILKLSVLQ
ncbi:dentin sialophosphoprotein-like [Panonychus citri]|uniref:dentin sialophosphoprotein-like n=1 Tax=Panonychus citri TaxID=50023 RepID=UPI0023070408|nr:dentin sialophosphoprotein-like [Panonychus citri]